MVKERGNKREKKEKKKKKIESVMKSLIFSHHFLKAFHHFLKVFHHFLKIFHPFFEERGEGEEERERDGTEEDCLELLVFLFFCVGVGSSLV